MFEERYQDELFLADELMSRGGAISSEEHAWLRKLTVNACFDEARSRLERQASSQPM